MNAVTEPGVKFNSWKRFYDGNSSGNVDSAIKRKRLIASKSVVDTSGGNSTAMPVSTSDSPIAGSYSVDISQSERMPIRKKLTAKKIAQVNNRAKLRVPSVQIQKKTAKKSAQRNNREKLKVQAVEINASESEVISEKLTEEVSTREVPPVNIIASKSEVISGKMKTPTKKIAKGPKTPVAAAKPKITPDQRTAPIELYSGPPDEELEGGWPNGWIKKLFERSSGKSKGSKDRYWYSPKTNKKFRSMIQVRRYMPILREYNGDEDAAWLKLKEK